MTVAFYNGFRDRLVEDYHVRNRRVVMALDFAKHTLAGCRTVLDVGCGIGWTTHELADTKTEVVGLDISPALIRTARAMFPAHRFVTTEFVAWQPEPVDAVVMIDVYEHFPLADRPAVHRQIRDTGATRLVMTVPTPEAMQYARDNSIPLQPIDEDVTDADIGAVAADLDGHIVVNRRVTVWRPNDYRHVLITC